MTFSKTKTQKNRKQYYIIMVFSLLILSCNKKSNVNNLDDTKNSDGTEKFICSKNKFSDFIVLSSNLDNTNKPRTIIKSFRAYIINNTNTIYKKAVLRPEIILELENGKTLSSKDIDYTRSLGGNPTFELKTNWKPNEEWYIDNLSTCSFSIEYIDYPVKNVYSQYYLEYEDQINGTNNELLVSEKDITKEWKAVIKKVKNKITDSDDSSRNISKFIDQNEK